MSSTSGPQSWVPSDCKNLFTMVGYNAIQCSTMQCNVREYNTTYHLIICYKYNIWIVLFRVQGPLGRAMLTSLFAGSRDGGHAYTPRL